PSINSYMYANARAISRLAALAGDAPAAALYARKAEGLREEVQKSLWSENLDHFIDRYRVDNRFVKYWQPIRGRELVGYVPWAFGLPTDDPRYAKAWAQLLSPTGFAGAAGLRTVEPSYEHYMRQYRYEKETGLRECQWNGPVWPFQTTQVLTAMANLLNDYHQTTVDRGDYLRLLRQYARLHYKDGKPDLEEDYDPETGKAIVGLARSHHYNHSGYADLIISGLVGLRPREDDVLEVNPLVPSDPNDPQALRYFALQDAPYHGRLVTVLFDADGSRYGRGKGLFVLVDGVQVAASPTLKRLTVPIARKAPPAAARPIDLAVNLVRSDFPKGSASVSADPASLHQALDGRTWFFPEMVNGWTAPAGAEAWFAVDFGRPVTVSAASLAFFADGGGFAPPAAYAIEVWHDGRWAAVGAAPPAVANGETKVAWPAVTAEKLRVRLTPAASRSVRLVELKVF
ncbi:MAG: hypothetical protein JWP92_2934, partial [Caulobacter sp.]|nr:hypothetical protein [Caulobacter sp.]